MDDQSNKIVQLRQDLEQSLRDADAIGARMTAIRIMEALEALEAVSIVTDQIEAVQN